MRLSQASEASFTRRLKTDSKLKRIARKARDSTSYEAANEYAVRVGELLSESLTENVKDLAYISEEVAREVLTPALTADHELVKEVSVQIQKNMNEANGYGIEALAPDLDTNRIEGLVQKVASYDTAGEALWVLGEPVINYSQAVTDQTIRKNAEANARMGIPAKIVRQTEAPGVKQREIKRNNKKYYYPYIVPCEWCKKMAGTYDYEDVKETGNDVYRRHEKCRCTITYIQGKRHVDVVSKTEWTEEDASRRSELIQQRAEEKRQEAQQRAQERQTRTAAIDRIQKELHYSPQGAGRLYNAWKRDGKLDRYTLDYLIATAQS